MSVWTLVAEEILYSTINQTVKQRAYVREHRQHRLTEQPGTDGSAETGLRRRLSRTAAHGSSSSSISAGPTARCSRKQNETQRPRLTAVVASSYLHRLCCREDGTKGSTWHTHTHPPWGGKKALVESITVWVLQLGALQSLLSDTQKLLAELLQGEAISLMPCCHANDWILQTKWRKLTWRWPQHKK